MNWIFKQGVTEFSEMTDLSLAEREKISRDWTISTLNPVEESLSNDGETRKILFRTQDGNAIETVDMKYEKRRTLCVSTQIGCKRKCAFCATGAMGFIRNLKVSEILGQILYFKDVTNIVFMGMGEPMDNLEALTETLFLLNDENHFSFGARRITVSTVGIPKGIYALAALKRQYGLSWSLHSTVEEVRSSIVPANRNYPIGNVLKAVKHYASTAKGDITIEYILLKK